ncbi:MAG: SMP-30/Gluconolaconase/LRE domain protein [Blastococcus sp.]|jgi:sugar lactone lactonase YvrE|nr:SMP-30/Gluconolaconase/LRE domain protein [Blastococcus sp.]
MPRMLQADLVLDAGAELGEGPLWDARSGVLSWVDLLAGRVHLCDADGRLLSTHELDAPVGAALPAAGGGYLLGDGTGLTLLGDDGATTPVLAMFDAAQTPRQRCNDAKCDPAGRAWVGTVARGLTPGAGALHRIDPGPRATTVLSGLTVANGLGWSPDAQTMWFTDSADPQVLGYAYDVDTGTLGEVRATVQVQAPPGAVPDGLCVDDEGAIWLGLWDGSAVHRYTPDGRLDTVVSVPAARATSCAFGGPNLATLYITTAATGLSDEELRQQPHAGGLFAVVPGVTGPAATPWRHQAATDEGER